MSCPKPRSPQVRCASEPGDRSKTRRVPSLEWGPRERRGGPAQSPSWKEEAMRGQAQPWRGCSCPPEGSTLGARPRAAPCVRRRLALTQLTSLCAAHNGIAALTRSRCLPPEAIPESEQPEQINRPAVPRKAGLSASACCDFQRRSFQNKNLCLDLEMIPPSKLDSFLMFRV